MPTLQSMQHRVRTVPCSGSAACAECTGPRLEAALAAARGHAQRYAMNAAVPYTAQMESTQHRRSMPEAPPRATSPIHMMAGAHTSIMLKTLAVFQLAMFWLKTVAEPNICSPNHFCYRAHRSACMEAMHTSATALCATSAAQQHGGLGRGRSAAARHHLRLLSGSQGIVKMPHGGMSRHQQRQPTH
jgi:hypothetical protein